MHFKSGSKDGKSNCATDGIYEASVLLSENVPGVSNGTLDPRQGHLYSP